MFFEVNKINSISNCSKCQERLDNPRILPCGQTICSQCQSTIHVDNKHYKCISCNKKHFMSKKGLPVNSLALALLSSQPSEVYRSPAVEELKARLKTMRQKFISLSFGINSGAEKVKEECAEMRSQMQLATEQAVQQINSFNEELINEINQFEIDTIQSYQQVEIKQEEAIKTVKHLDAFHSK